MKVDSLLEKLTLLEKMEKMVQRRENSRKASLLEERGAIPKYRNLSTITTPLEESKIRSEVEP